MPYNIIEDFNVTNNNESRMLLQMLSIKALEGVRVGHCGANSCVPSGSVPATTHHNPPAPGFSSCTSRLCVIQFPDGPNKLLTRDHRAKVNDRRSRFSYSRKSSGQVGRPSGTRQLW